jgi:hypothetical protein
VAAIHVYLEHIPSPGHSDAYYALAGALGGAVVTGVLGVAGLALQSRHENGRLLLRLNHDQDQQDLAVLRTILGDAAEALGQDRTAFIRLLRYIDVPSGSVDRARRDDAMSQQRRAAAATRAALDRLRLQLEPGDELLSAYEAVMQALDKIADLVATRPQGYYDAIAALDPTLAERTDKFIRLALERVGPRTADEHSPKRWRSWGLVRGLAARLQE